MCFLGFHLLSETFCDFFSFLYNAVQSFTFLLSCQHKFRCRIHHDLFHGIHGTLAVRIKSTDGIYLIPPQFDAVREFLRQCKNIHDTATDGKFARCFYLIDTLITQPYQTSAQHFQIYRILILQPQQKSTQHFRPYQAVQQCIKSSDNGRILFLKQGPECLDPLLCQCITTDIRLIEQNILCWKIYRFSVKIPVSIQQFPCLLFIKSNNDTHTPAIVPSVHHMWFLCIHTAGCREHRTLLCRGPLQFLKTAQFMQRTYKSIHVIPPLHLFKNAPGILTARCTSCNA